MRSLRHFLIAVLLLLAQIGASAHALEHALGEAQGVPGHVCELCLAAHDLGAGLVSPPALPLVCQAVPEAAEAPCLPAFHLPPPRARQGAPPFA